MNTTTKAERNKLKAEIWPMIALSEEGGIFGSSYLSAATWLLSKQVSLDRVKRYIAEVARRKRDPKYFRDGNTGNPFEAQP